MKPLFLIYPLIFTLFLGGCSHFTNRGSSDQQKDDASLQQSPSEIILSCLQSQWNLSRKEYKIAHNQTKEKHNSLQSDFNTLQLICFNVHPLSRSNQFREGMKQLSLFRANHPSDTSGIGGLEHLLQLLDRERNARWNLSNKIKEDKENIAIENKELLERNQQLKWSAEQDKNRLEELKKQIDQLKNIENIIKNRDH